MNNAVFLDRDGVINEMFFDKFSNEYRPPHMVDEIKFIDRSFEAIKLLNDKGYNIFIISNQPDYAKGKTAMENLNNVKEYIEKMLYLNNCDIKEHYYCYHHPQGTVKGYNIKCECRKPGTFFVEEAVKKYSVNRKMSYFVGDRTSDIQCGKNAVLNTIYIENNVYKLSEALNPDFTVVDLYAAVNKIIKDNERNIK